MFSKTALVTVDSFGQELMRVPGCSAPFASCSAMDEAGDVLFAQLTGFGITSETADCRIGLITDFDDVESSWIATKVGEKIQERLKWATTYAYVAHPSTAPNFQAITTLGSYFQRTFIVARGMSPEKRIQGTSRVIMAHGVQELTPHVFGKELPAYVFADAWELTPRKLNRRGTTPTFHDLAKHIFPVAFEAIDTIIGDLRDRLNGMIEMLPIFGRSEDVETYDMLIKPVAEVLDKLAQSSADIDWEGLLCRVPHGLEVQETLRLSLQEEFASGLRSRDVLDLVNMLPRPAAEKLESDEAQAFDRSANDPWHAEITSLQGIMGGRAELNRHKLWRVREKAEWNCRLLLKTLDSPLIRRRMLRFLLEFSLKKQEDVAQTRQEDSTRVQDVVENDLELVRDELRSYLHQARGGGLFLVLPKDFMEEASRNDLRLWVEQIMGSSCKIVTTQGPEAWLYAETPYDSKPAPHVLPLGKNGMNGGSPSGDPSPEPSPSRTNKHCLACGSDFSIPPLQIPPDFGIKSEKGASPPKTCPQCQRLNGKDWWLCQQHGKFFVPVPIDKCRCPDCILRHHQDPIIYPLSSIGVRPGFVEPFLCPNCVEIRKDRPWHEVFKIEEELVPFYKNGVNGHDSAKFPELAAKHGLLDGYRCPGCATLLIPVDHRHKDTSLPA